MARTKQAAATPEYGTVGNTPPAITIEEASSPKAAPSTTPKVDSVKMNTVTTSTEAETSSSNITNTSTTVKDEVKQKAFKVDEEGDNKISATVKIDATSAADINVASAMNNAAAGASRISNKVTAKINPASATNIDAKNNADAEASHISNKEQSDKETVATDNIPKTPANKNISERKVSSAPAGPVSPASSKRSADDAELADKSDDEDTDSDLEFLVNRPVKKGKKVIAVAKKTSPGKKLKLKKNDFELPVDCEQVFGNINHEYASSDEEGHAEGSCAVKIKQEDAVSDVSVSNDNNDVKMEDSEDDEEDDNPHNPLRLSTPALKRSERIVNEEDPKDRALIEAAIAAGLKAGAEIYDSDAEELEGAVANVMKADLFRNVKWADECYNKDDDDFEVTPFTQFVPGRWEHLPDGSLRDQKNKLVVRLVDKNGNRRIFLNPPPKDWKNQEALTALNKRVVQQIRRNTTTRFRSVVIPYAQFERKWILANLDKNAKPKKGWTRFVADFNETFAGNVLEEGPTEPRPRRSHSSLTKEVERFSKAWYSKGKIPIPVKDSEKRKVGAEKREKADKNRRKTA